MVTRSADIKHSVVISVIVVAVISFRKSNTLSLLIHLTSLINYKYAWTETSVYGQMEMFRHIYGVGASR